MLQVSPDPVGVRLVSTGVGREELPQVISAVDADSGIEVVVMGPTSASQAELQSLALKKLQVRLEKEGR